MKLLCGFFWSLVLFLPANAQKGRFAMQLFYAGTYSFRSFETVKQHPEPLFKPGYKNEIPMYGNSIMLGITYAVNNQFYLSSGIEYSIYSIGRLTDDFRFSDAIIARRGFTLPSSEGKTPKTFKVKENLNYLAIPLNIGFRYLDKKRISLVAEVGAAYNIAITRQLKTVIFYTDKSKKRSSRELSEIQNAFSVNVALPIRYELNPSIAFEIAPAFIYFITPTFQNEWVKERIYSGSMQFGAVINTNIFKR